VNPSAPPGKSEKYARREHERRFLLAAPPLPASIAATTLIIDRYIEGTRLRLRAAVAAGGTAYKLTQKVPSPGGGPGLLTTVYLDAAEHAVFAALPARVLRKTRHHLPPLVVDVFEPPLHGLVLAEAEFDSEAEVRAFPAPPAALAEVTRDSRFGGGRLAATTRGELVEVLAGFGLDIACANDPRR
jgi:CYTH domain-containing protein